MGVDTPWQLPSTPLLISSTCGGPFCIFVCTPLRNGLTLGSQDARSSLRALYGKVFRGGVRRGWTGGFAPACAACPQFFALGPVYHFLHDGFRRISGLPTDQPCIASSLLATACSGFVETWMTFGSQSRNAQMAYNSSMVQFTLSVEPGMRKPVPLNKPFQIWGVGAGMMTLRNTVTLSSVRAISPVLDRHIPADGLSSNARAMLCDATASVLTCFFSSPIHQTFNFLATTPDAQHLSLRERRELILRFLQRQYFVPKPRETMIMAPDLSRPAAVQEYTWKLSRTAIRDFSMRAIYVTSVFTLYTSIERFLSRSYPAVCTPSHVHVPVGLELVREVKDVEHDFDESALHV